jgi:hypothetical protein
VYDKEIDRVQKFLLEPWIYYVWMHSALIDAKHVCTHVICGSPPGEMTSSECNVDELSLFIATSAAMMWRCGQGACKASSLPACMPAEDSMPKDCMSLCGWCMSQGDRCCCV